MTQPSVDRRGFVYILTNETMPGLVKIGRTARDCTVRANELWQTGVPTPFVVFASVGSLDCVQLEAFVHGALAKQRVSKSREFFACDPFIAEEALKYWSLYQTDEIVSGLDAGLSATPYAASVGLDEVRRLSAELDQPIRIIADAMEALAADELRPAVERVRTRYSREDPEHLRLMDESFVWEKGGLR